MRGSIDRIMLIEQMKNCSINLLIFFFCVMIRRQVVDTHQLVQSTPTHNTFESIVRKLVIGLDTQNSNLDQMIGCTSFAE